MTDKLCPMRKETRKLWERGELVGTYEVASPCIGEQCAWWNGECAIRCISCITDALGLISDTIHDAKN